MQKQPYIYIALILLLSNCKQNPSIDPAIPEKQLITALLDLHIAEVAVKSLRGTTKDSVLNVYYDQVYEMHGLERKKTEAYLEKLRTDPKYWDALYQKVEEAYKQLDAQLKEAEKQND